MTPPATSPTPPQQAPELRRRRHRRRPTSASAGIVLRRELASPGKARACVRAALNDWHANDDETGTVLLIVSELVTNAVTHTDSALIRVMATLLDDVVRLVVAAEQAHEGEIRADVAADSADHGRGLFIVETTADRWGVRPIAGTGCALAVWAEYQLSTATSRGTTC